MLRKFEDNVILLKKACNCAIIKFRGENYEDS